MQKFKFILCIEARHEELQHNIIGKYLQRVDVDVEATIDLIGSVFRWLCVFDINGFKQQSSDNIPQTAHKCIKN